MAGFLESFANEDSAIARVAEYLNAGIPAVMFEVPGVDVIPYGGDGYEELFNPPVATSWIVAVAQGEE